MLIPLANLRPDPNPVRRIFDAEADAELLRSLSTAGQFEPILVIPGEGDTYTVRNGNRRLRLAPVAGIDALEAHILPNADEAYLAGVALAANTLHAPLAPVDQWRALVAMLAKGKALPDAAAFLGISERQAERLERLGRLAPAVLAMIERHGMPAERFLRTIAAAPVDMQKKAAANKAIINKRGDQVAIDWHQLAQLCTRRTYTRAAAIFDTSKAKITWQQDVFAQPGSPEEWTTAECDRFMKHQVDALEALAAASKGKISVAEESARHPGQPDLPKGWAPNHGGNPDKPKRNEVVYACVVALTGQVVRVVAIDAAAEAAAAKEKERKAKEKAKAEAKAAKRATLATEATPGISPALGTVETPLALTPASEPATPPEPEATAPTAEDAAPLTKDGQKHLARLKTDALRTKLRHPTFASAIATADRTIAMLILALHARNVEVKGYDAPEGARWGAERGADILRRLITPEGHLQFDAAELPRLACETLARVLSASPPDAPYHLPGSGEVAEWIGADITAESRMPLLTTPEFLATWKTPALREAATAAAVKFSTATQARRDLANTLAPDSESGKATWLPTFAQFGAPGPKPAKEG
jgi:ParB family chromosome partitioning protein